MTLDLVLLIQVSFLLFLPAMLVVAVWIGNKAILLLDAHLERLQATFRAMHDLQEKNHGLLLDVLRKVIVQGAEHK